MLGWRRWRSVRRWLCEVLGLAVIGRAARWAGPGARGLLYLPFYIGFQSQLGGLRPNLLFPSRFSQFSSCSAFLVVAVASCWH